MASSDRLPGWISAWFAVTAIVCTWDASMITLRPHTLPGGSLHTFWKPYALYIEVDRRYKDMNDTFVYCVSLMNYAEVILNLFTLYMNHKGSKHTLLLAFTTSVMTWWKTVLYLLQYLEFSGGGEYTKGVDPLTAFFILWIPNGTWVVVPFIVMAALWEKIVHKQGQSAEKKGL